MELKFNIHPVRRGRLYEMTEVRNASSPNKFGNQPKRKMIKELVDQEYTPSKSVHFQKRPTLAGKDLSFEKSFMPGPNSRHPRPSASVVYKDS